MATTLILTASAVGQIGTIRYDHDGENDSAKCIAMDGFGNTYVAETVTADGDGLNVLVTSYTPGGSVRNRMAKGVQRGGLRDWTHHPKLTNSKNFVDKMPCHGIQSVRARNKHNRLVTQWPSESVNRGERNTQYYGERWRPRLGSWESNTRSELGRELTCEPAFAAHKR